MFKPTYTKLDASLNPLPADHPNDGADKHLLVRVEHPMLAKAFIVSAYRAGDRATFVEAKKAAEEFQIHGHACRAGHVEELFLIADRTREEVGLDTNFFPDAEGYESTWTGDIDSTSPRDYAWIVDLGDGSCDWGGRSYRGHVRPVLAGQS
jgi:hypothetical protein